ncbi:MDR family MFS transporter [Brevibacillus dissolubilis]|uniref:MDR family MFS transporter n=1 Tax=Brevibacillus dissolubilis TaxID=1844116 RepID=UPI0011177101|nr:MFS transporter [Brevibacillus dissolubilis]
MQWLSWNMNLKVRLIGETIFHLFFWMFFPFMSLHFAASFGKDMASLLLVVPPLLGMIASLIGGQMADRIGRRPTMLFANVLEAVALALFAFSHTPWLDYIAFILLGIGGSIYWPASEAMVADLTSEEERRDVFAVFYMAMNIGVVGGPLIGAFFFEHHRFGLMLTSFIVVVVFLVVLFVMIKETLPESAKKASQLKPKQGILRQQAENYRVIFSDKLFAMYISAGILLSIVFMQMDMYMPVYIKESVPEQTLLVWGDWSFSLSSMEIFGWMVGINGLMVVLLTTPVTRLFSGWSDRDGFILSSLLTGAGLLMMVFSTNVWYLFFCMAVFTFGELVRTPIALGFVSKYAPEDKRGQYMGASTLQFSVGRFLAPLVIGMSNWMTPLSVFAIIAMFGVFSAVLYYRLFRHVDMKRSSQSATGAVNQPEKEPNPA